MHGSTAIVKRLKSDSDALSVDQHQARMIPSPVLSRVSEVMECGVGDVLLRFDVGRADHLAPLLHLFGDQSCEIGGRARHCRAGLLSEPLPKFGIGEGGVDLLC
jgi:hypothetical protein